MPPHAAHLSVRAATVRFIMPASAAKSVDVMLHAECAIADHDVSEIHIPSCSPAPVDGLVHVKASSPSPTRFTRHPCATALLSKQLLDGGLLDEDTSLTRCSHTMAAPLGNSYPAAAPSAADTNPPQLESAWTLGWH